MVGDEHIGLRGITLWVGKALDVGIIELEMDGLKLNLGCVILL